MGERIIPEQRIVSCDFCERVRLKGKDPAWLLSGKLTYQCDGLDFQGNAVGPGDNVTTELCDRCYDKALSALSEAYLKIARLKEASDEQKES